MLIDEPESALHLTAISRLLDIVAILAERGIQFFCSHSYFVVKKLFLVAQTRNWSIPVISATSNGWGCDDLKKRYAGQSDYCRTNRSLQTGSRVGSKMTTEAIIESGMTFGPFAAGECFYVEKSKCYGLIQDGVQMAEFLLLRQKQDHAPVIWVVEAKSSSPRPATQPNFTEVHRRNPRQAD